MSNKDENEICVNCLYFAIKKSAETECRKYAPRGGEGRIWTQVKAQEWCGEFKGKDEGPGQVGKEILKRGVSSNK